jgi:hypothetical protein
MPPLNDLPRLSLPPSPTRTTQLNRTPLDVVPPEAAAVARMLTQGRIPAGARSPSAAPAAGRATPALSPCKSPTGLAGSVAGAKALRSGVASPVPAANARASHAASSSRPGSPTAAPAAPAAAPLAPAAVPAPLPSTSPAVPTESTIPTASSLLSAAQELESGQWREAPPPQPELQPLRASLALARSPPRKSAQLAPHRSPQQEGGGLRHSLIGQRGPLHQHQSQRAEEENAKWQKVSGTVQGLLRLLEEQDARVAQLEAANSAAADRIAQHEAAVDRSQQEQASSVAALSDSVKQLLTQGRALLRQGTTPSPDRTGRPASAPVGDRAGGAGAGGGAGALDPSVEEFMEATSGCLQLHEKRLDDLLVGLMRR